MLKNYIKIAWRNMLANKVYSSLNIIGLAAGMAVALITGLWVFHEYSYDNALPDAGRLFQVKVNFTSKHDGIHTQNAISLPTADALRTQFPEIKYVAEADWNQEHSLIVGDKKIYQKGMGVGADFLKMFQFKLLKGSAGSVLKNTYSIVLTQATAKALFGDADPIDKTIKIDNSQSLRVTGIIADVPGNSSFSFHYLFPFSYLETTYDRIKAARTKWTNNSFQIFAMLQPNANQAMVNAGIKNIIGKNSDIMRTSKPVLFLYPLKKWHLFTEFENGQPAGGFIDYVRMFTLIGVLVLLIACINFMNLATARSEKRAREIGVRKAVGSQRKDLVFQFLTESVLMSLLSFVLAMLMVQLTLPSFNSLTGSEIHIPYGNAIFWLLMGSYVLITGLVAGSRPAFYLSSFNPVKVLKGGVKLGRAAALPRKILVVTQFSCSIALIISTVIIYEQIEHAKSRPSGYSSDRLVMSDMSDDLNNHYDALKNDLMQTGLVQNVTRASSPVTDIYSHTSLDSWPGKAAGDESVNVATFLVDDNYFKTTSMQLLAGHGFSADYKADTMNVILNEAAVKRMGLKDPINAQISWNNHPEYKLRVIGVVKNAIMDSPFTPVMPGIFAHGQWGSVAMYRLKPNVNTQEAIAIIGKLFDKYNPAYPFSFQFADDEYNNKFHLEVLVGKLAGVFAGLAILISCLGLFGLAAYMAEQRTKEIGIRKVMGASVSQLWVLLSTDFVLLVMISCVIASPVAWYFLHNWLQKYNYHISINLGVFVLSALAAIGITLLTISFQAIRAAIANPVKSLRSE